MLDQHLRLAESYIQAKDWESAVEEARQLGNYMLSTQLFKVTAPNLRRIGRVLATVAMIQQGRMK